jgi:hypothetical protein
MNYTRPGFIILVLVIFGVLLPVLVADTVLTARGRHPIGYQVNQFVLAYPWFAAILAFVLGAMIAHFFLNIAYG